MHSSESRDSQCHRLKIVMVTLEKLDMKRVINDVESILLSSQSNAS